MVPGRIFSQDRTMNDLEKMRSGRWLHAVTPEIGEALRRAEELCFRLNQLPPSHRQREGQRRSYKSKSLVNE